MCKCCLKTAPAILSDVKVTRVSHFAPKTNESHDTRETGDLKMTTVSHFAPKTSESHDTRAKRVTKTARPTSSDLKMTTVTHFAPKTSESHDTRETSDLKPAADHQLLNASV